MANKIGAAAERHFDFGHVVDVAFLAGSKRNERKLLADTLRKSQEKTLAHFEKLTSQPQSQSQSTSTLASLKVKKDFQRICEFATLQRQKQKPSICI